MKIPKYHGCAENFMEGLRDAPLCEYPVVKVSDVLAFLDAQEKAFEAHATNCHGYAYMCATCSDHKAYRVANRVLRAALTEAGEGEKAHE